MRDVLTDDLWAAMRPLVGEARRHRGGYPPAVPDRVVFEALLSAGRTGVPWRDLPGELGAWDAMYRRLRRRAASGGLRRLFEGPTADPRPGDVRRVLIDGPIVRAHPHTAGAALLKKARPRPVGGRTGARPEPRRADDRGGPDGRRRGHRFGIDAVPGQAHEAPHLSPAAAATTERAGVLDEVVGDRAFDADNRRHDLLARGVMPPVPSKANRADPWPTWPGSRPYAVGTTPRTPRPRRPPNRRFAT